MGIVFRQSVKTLLVTSTGAFLGALLMYWSAKYLPSNESFGFIRNLTYATLVISQICLFGLNNTLFLFFQRFKDNPKKRRLLISICFFGPTIITLILSALAFIFKYQIVHLYKNPADIAKIDKYFIWFPVYVLIWCYVILLETYAYLNMKAALSTFMREILLRLLNIVLIALFSFGIIDFSWFVGGTVLVSTVPILLLAIIAVKTGKFGFSFNLNILSGDEYKDLLNYSWSHLLTNMSATLIENLPLLLLGIFYKQGLSAVGIYTIAVYIASVSQIPYKSMALSTSPVLTEAYHNKDSRKVADLFLRSSINIFIVVALMFNIICLNMHNVTSILPTNYSSFEPIVIILMLGKLIDMGTGLNSELIAISEYYKYNFRLSLILPFLLCLSSWLFIPKYGLYGAAWGTCISTAFFNLCKLAFLWWKWKITPFSKNTLLIIFAGGVSGLCGYLLPYLFNATHHVYVHAFIDTAFRSLVITLVYIIMLLWLKPSEDLVTYIASIKKNKRLF